ncbi:MAG TPA: nuclear transport factor 2 family protein [Opitutaceae bacterium]
MISRRHFILAAGASALATVPVRAGISNADTRKTLAHAVETFFRSWHSGNWDPFLSLLTPEFTFQFPTGPQRGRHVGAEGRRRIEEWARAHTREGNRITASAPDLRLYDGDWVVVCDRGSGEFGGQRYTGLHAIFMRAEGDRIAEFREYFGELPQ